MGWDRSIETSNSLFLYDPSHRHHAYYNEASKEEGLSHCIEITLEEITPMLTTVYVKVRGKTREASVERAIAESIQAKLDGMNTKQRFRFAGYHNLRTKPDIKTAQLGWYRKSAKLDAYRKGKSDWFKLKLPSGKTAYLKDDEVKGKFFALNK